MPPLSAVSTHSSSGPSVKSVEQPCILDAFEGRFCICAAGNSAGAVEFPAAFPEAVAISATGLAGKEQAGSLSGTWLPLSKDLFGRDNLYLSNFSCFGPEIACTAPGVGIISTVQRTVGGKAGILGHGLNSNGGTHDMRRAGVSARKQPGVSGDAPRYNARTRRKRHSQPPLPRCGLEYQSSRTRYPIAASELSLGSGAPRSAMAIYVVATRRSARGKARTAREVLAEAPGVRIRGDSNPDIVVIEVSPERVETLRREIGSTYRIERDIPHSPAGVRSG